MSFCQFVCRFFKLVVHIFPLGLIPQRNTVGCPSWSSMYQKKRPHRLGKHHGPKRDVLVASLLLVAMPFVPSSFLLLVVRPLVASLLLGSSAACKEVPCHPICFRLCHKVVRKPCVRLRGCAAYILQESKLTKQFSKRICQKSGVWVKG